MNTYLTELTAVGPDGELRKYAGPRIEADSYDAARAWCATNEMPYLRVIGKLE